MNEVYAPILFIIIGANAALMLTTIGKKALHPAVLPGVVLPIALLRWNESLTFQVTVLIVFTALTVANVIEAAHPGFYRRRSSTADSEGTP